MLALFPASGLVKRVVVTGVKRGHAGTASLPRLGASRPPGTPPPRLPRRATTCRTLAHALPSACDATGGGAPRGRRAWRGGVRTKHSGKGRSGGEGWPGAARRSEPGAIMATHPKPL